MTPLSLSRWTVAPRRRVFYDRGSRAPHDNNHTGEVQNVINRTGFLRGIAVAVGLAVAVGMAEESPVAENPQPGLRVVEGGSVPVSAVAAPRSGAYWPGWLGPRRDGWVSDFRPPKRWPTTLTKSWQVKVGTGYGSPLVAGNRVYQHARQGGDEVLWCFDLATGKARWRQSYPAPFKIGGGGQYHGKGPKSSPVMADGRIFTMGITGKLIAWDATSGKAVENKETGSGDDWEAAPAARAGAALVEDSLGIVR